jgi:hypothetical protein
MRRTLALCTFAICVGLWLTAHAGVRLLMGVGAGPSASAPWTHLSWTCTTGCTSSGGASSLTISRPSGTIPLGACVLVGVVADPTAIITVSDGSHTYRHGPTIASNYIFSFMTLGTTAGGSTTTASSTGGNLYALLVDEFDGCGTWMDASTFNVQTSSVASGTTNGVTSSSLSTISGNDMVWGYTASNSSSTSIAPGSGFIGGVAADSGFTAIGAYSSTYKYANETEYAIEPTAGSYAATFTPGATDYFQTVAVALVPAGAPAPTPGTGTVTSHNLGVYVGSGTSATSAPAGGATLTLVAGDTLAVEIGECGGTGTCNGSPAAPTGITVSSGAIGTCTPLSSGAWVSTYYRALEYECPITTGGSNVTVTATWAGTTYFMHLAAQDVSGTQVNSPNDNIGNVAQGNGTAATVSSVDTTGHTNELAIAVIYTVQDTTSFTPGSGWAILDSQSGTSSSMAVMTQSYAAAGSSITAGMTIPSGSWAESLAVLR